MMEAGMNLYAHKKESENQLLSEHLLNVAQITSEFAKEFNNSDWGKFAGFFHDVGKSFSDWQKHLIEGKSTSINHSEAGAYIVHKKFREDDFWKRIECFQNVVSYLIAGHHAGLPDFHPGSGNDLKGLLNNEKTKRMSEELLEIKELSNFFEAELPKSLPFGSTNLSVDFANDFHLWIRMLYSCLVDADFLDTEKFMTPEEYECRGKYENLEVLKNRFDLFMAEKQANAKKSKINDIRKSIYNSCIEKAKLPSGFYSLNVPTGGGKTLASMAFALNHALINGKKRIITAIPYTSIIEQTSNVYKFGTDDIAEIEELKKNGKCLFGEENVLEHHSNFDFDKKENAEVLKKLKLSCENWDAPIIVTTNVQLFESLFNAHSSHCRKLHNLANSVIILDEVQMLPPGFLKSILSVLQSLVKNFGVTVVLCTATQPSLTGKIGTNTATFDGIPESQITHIIENPEELSEALKRVEVNAEFAREKLTDWQQLADELVEYEQVLCIVQTRKDCRELHRLMPEGTIHLSALMCAEERSEIIAKIKSKLKSGDPIRVISTQLVECGVDIDFPVVFKALSGLDSIAQAAGRCNREGRLKEFGNVFVFNPPSKIPVGLLRKGADATDSLFKKYDYKIELKPQIYAEYFKNYFSSINNFDNPDFRCTMLDEAKYGHFQFRTLSDNYHLIDNSFQGTVYIYFESKETGKNNLDLLESLRRGEITKSLMRKLNRYSVNLPINEIKELVDSGRVIKPFADMDIFIQSLDDRNLYQNGLGLVADSLHSFETYIF